ncbi:ABC transporter ATP-binding protein [Brucepastera parasyntrophica]|uniref:ABC transporter ATP-binding protein n=1 Tax=Brucepastera parasyntrophica TaxID=2880008 RepID=UPI00210904A2|nr:ABC transporter ATP-binding protein [Brucepastera parasyntrophica]ULQ58734.1 ABC transporter ATP-binding protein [Brucepastera parasyntrophica]
MSGYAIETEDITKIFPNGVTAVKSLNLKIPEGTVFGFLGPNGAGKTTTVRILNGSLTPTSGTYKVFSSSGDDSMLRSITATLGDHTGMYASLTVRNNLRFFAAMYGMEKDRTEKRIEEVIDKLHLNDKIDAPLGTLSTGLTKRVQLARVMLHHPRLLFLDEPTSGLDPDAADEVNRMIRLLADEEKTTVFLCTHNLSLAQSICDIFGFISKGS